MANPERYRTTLPGEEKLPVPEKRSFTEEENEIIERKRRSLSSIAYFIGKDFEMPVELNKPGEGWHWDFAQNVIRVDPVDLLEKPDDYLRFVIAHEGGHRRVSRTDFIPKEEWQETGFPFLMSVIEDPRMNNFIAEAYPRIREQMEFAYPIILALDIEKKAEDLSREKVGSTPKHMQAGFEYIKQWFKQSKGEPFELSSDLPHDVRAVLEKTLADAEDSWLRYPTKKEADTGEDIINKYAEKSYRINREKVWPEFKKLVDDDVKNEAMRQALEDMKEKSKGDDDKEKEGESKDGEGWEGKPISDSDLPESLKEKLQKYFDSLPEDKKEELTKRAEEMMSELDKEIGKALQGIFDKEKEGVAPKESEEPLIKSETKKKTEEVKKEKKKPEKKSEKDLDVIRKEISGLLKGKEKNSAYEKALDNVGELVDELSSELREVFAKRKLGKRAAGYRAGKWNIRQRIREIISDIPFFKTQAREQVELAGEEKDYAITIMVDCSGSMLSNNKAREAFRSVVLLGETLNNLDIHFEIVGFQDALLEFKRFDDNLDEETKAKMSTIPLEIAGKSPNGHNEPGDNDDGACLLEASSHLALRPERNKFIIVLSDGSPAMDSHLKSSSQLDQELKDAVSTITSESDQKLIGVGINSSAVRDYYPNNLPNVSAKELAGTLGELVRDLIENS